MRTLLVNKIKCPDGNILHSRGRHDYQAHVQEDGRMYSIDGGFAYHRCSYSDMEYIDLCLYSDDTHEKIRNNFEWTRNYDKDMNLLPQPETKLLRDLTDDHIVALVKFTKINGYGDMINKVFIDEVKWRGI